MNNPHIMFNCPESFPDILVDRLTSDIKTEKLNLQINKLPHEPYAAIEWAIPGIIAIFIAQNYFGGFLKELGKEHYFILKKWIKKTAIDSRNIKVTTLTASKSTKKIDKTNSQSKAFSVYIQTANNKSLKLLFDLNLNNLVWESAIDKIVDLAYDNYINFPNDKLTLEISKLDTNSRTIYAIINPDSKDWEFLDQTKLIQKIRNSKGE